MADQALHIQWCGDALLAKPYKHMTLNSHGSPNVTYTKVCRHGSPNHTNQNCFNDFIVLFVFYFCNVFYRLVRHGLSNHCICKCLWAMCPHIILYVMCGEPWAFKPLYLWCLVNPVFPNPCMRIVWWAMGPQTIVFEWSGKPCVQKQGYR